MTALPVLTLDVL